MKKLGIIFSVIIAISLMPWAPSVSAESDDGLGYTGDITITLEAGQYEINQVGEYSIIDMEGFGSILNHGEPKLPSKTFLIGLPPGAEAVSVDMVASDYAEIPGEYRIMPAPPIVSGEENENVKWGENGEIYSSENAYPSSVYAYLGMGQMRKYYFARVRFCPIAYYPASNKLGLYRSITLKIKYEISQVVPPELRSDTVMDDVASETIFNYAPMKSQYQSAAAPSAVSYNYVIITTDSLQSAVEPLVTWKTAIGYSVNVVTTTWISSNYFGLDLPEKIRNFLIDKYAEWGIEYVLIVGSHSTIPMRVCYPDASNHTSSPDPFVDGRTPTDYYYADLTGNWDSDGDGYFGEYGQDNVDFYPEVYVGRLPIDNSATVTSICQKSADFEQDNGSWKKKALLLGAITNYENEDGEGYPKTDGAALMEECWNDILSGKGYSRERMYEKEGLAPSIYACAHPLTQSNVLNASYGWRSGYGIVNWSAHGGPTVAARLVWATDDGDDVPKSSEMEWYDFISSSDATSLDDSKPAIVFSSSCITAYPEETNNLGKSLLERGAVAFLGATRLAWATVGWQNEGDAGCNSIDYYFFDYLINQEQKCGDALYNSKRYYLDNLGAGPWDLSGWCQWQNMFDFCLYGEPSLGTTTISLPANPSLHTHLLGVIDTTIHTPADLNHAKICLSGAPYREAAEVALGTYGIDYAEVFMPSTERFLALKTGIIDAVLVTEHPWDALVADGFETEVRFLPWSNEAIEAVEAEFPWVTATQLPANTYPWQAEPVRGYTWLNYESLDYFKITEGHGIKYHVTDDWHALDCNVWAVSQYFETNKPSELDFVFTLIKEGTEGGYLNSSLGGQVSRNIGGKNLTLFGPGYPVGNQASFYRNFSLPRFFNSGDEWSTWGNKDYSVEYVGSQTFNGAEFDDCIKVSIDDSLNESEYLRGTGYFILARDIGIVKLVFNRANGQTVLYEYVEHEQLTKHTISGTITEGGVPVEGIIVQISNANWGIRSVTDSSGAFSVQAYGPDIILRIGYDEDNDDVFEFDHPNFPREYSVNNITSDITGLSINIPVELKHDDGTSDGSWAIGGPGRGHVVHFSPPVTPFSVDRVKIYGALYGSGCEERVIEVEIWDEDFHVLHQCEQPYTIFGATPDWVAVETPGVMVDGDFYVFVLTDSPEHCNVQIYYDSSVVNMHSEVTEAGKIADWYLKTPKEKVNWMIRVYGSQVTIPEPWDPWDYDQNGDGEIQKSEAIQAVWDYFDGKITKEQTIEVVLLYFG